MATHYIDVTVGDRTVKMESQAVMGVGLWPASSQLALALLDALGALPAGSVGLELGAGGGLPSVVAATAGHSVVATDCDEDVIPLLQRNAAANGCEAKMRVRTLDWQSVGDAQALIDEVPSLYSVMYGSDIVYTAGDIRPLLQTVGRLLARFVCVSLRAHTLFSSIWVGVETQGVGSCLSMCVLCWYPPPPPCTSTASSKHWDPV